MFLRIQFIKIDAVGLSSDGMVTTQKTIFSFSKCSENKVFPKKLHWNMIFLVLSGKTIFFLHGNIYFFHSTENERRSFSRNTWKYDNFLYIYVNVTKMILPFCQKDNLLQRKYT